MQSTRRIFDAIVVNPIKNACSNVQEIWNYTKKGALVGGGSMTVAAPFLGEAADLAFGAFVATYFHSDMEKMLKYEAEQATYAAPGRIIRGGVTGFLVGGGLGLTYGICKVGYRGCKSVFGEEEIPIVSMKEFLEKSKSDIADVSDSKASALSLKRR